MMCQKIARVLCVAISNRNRRRKGFEMNVVLGFAIGVVIGLVVVLILIKLGWWDIITDWFV
jgi:uncharacterized membrane protein YgaE (UPF0421/DUF939 family)